MHALHISCTETHTHAPWPGQSLTTNIIFCPWEVSAAKIPTTFNFLVCVSKWVDACFVSIFLRHFCVCKLPQINMACVNININAVLALRYCCSHSVWSVYCISKHLHMALSAFCCALGVPKRSVTILYKWCLCAHMLHPRYNQAEWCTSCTSTTCG